MVKPNALGTPRSLQHLLDAAPVANAAAMSPRGEGVQRSAPGLLMRIFAEEAQEYFRVHDDR